MKPRLKVGEYYEHDPMELLKDTYLHNARLPKSTFKLLRINRVSITVRIRWGDPALCHEIVTQKLSIVGLDGWKKINRLQGMVTLGE